jgi:hypothetical protein
LSTLATIALRRTREAELGAKVDVRHAVRELLQVTIELAGLARADEGRRHVAAQQHAGTIRGARQRAGPQ